MSLVKWLAHPSVSRSLLRSISAASAGALLLSMSGGVAAKERSTDTASPPPVATVALSDLPPTTQASLPSSQHLREALNVGVVEDESGVLLFRVRPPAAGSPQPAQT